MTKNVAEEFYEKENIKQEGEKLRYFIQEIIDRFNENFDEINEDCINQNVDDYGVWDDKVVRGINYAFKYLKNIK